MVPVRARTRDLSLDGAVGRVDKTIYKWKLHCEKARAGAVACGAQTAQASGGAFICVQKGAFDNGSGRRGRSGMGALALKKGDKKSAHTKRGEECFPSRCAGNIFPN